MRRIHSQLSSQAPSGTSQRKDIKPTQALGVRQEGGMEWNEILGGGIRPTNGNPYRLTHAVVFLILGE